MNGTEVQMIFVAYRTHSRLSSRILPRTNLCYLVVLNIKNSGFICLNTHSSPVNNKAFFKPQIKIGAMCFSGSCDQLAWNGHMKFWIFFHLERAKCSCLPLHLRSPVLTHLFGFKWFSLDDVTYGYASEEILQSWKKTLNTNIYKTLANFVINDWPATIICKYCRATRKQNKSKLNIDQIGTSCIDWRRKTRYSEAHRCF